MKSKNIFTLATFIFIILASGCAQQKKPDQTAMSTLKGVSLSPKSYQSADFTDFFEKAKQAGRIVSWAGDWNELIGSSGGPKVLAELAQQYSYIPLIEAQCFSQSSGKLLRPLDEKTRQSYKTSVADFAEKYKPKYLAIGIEVNVLYEKSPADFDAFTAFYTEVYDTVKAKSPGTKVFTIFQLEKMKGLSGGLFGGTNDLNKTQWQLLDTFPKNDIIAFTTYPCLIYKSPEDIPANYYTEIKSHTLKPVAFTEVGWHSAASPAGWESSEAEQAQFIAKFFNLTRDLNSEMAIWSFMYDQNTIEPFKSMGLIRSHGSVGTAWDAWVSGN